MQLILSVILNQDLPGWQTEMRDIAAANGDYVAYAMLNTTPEEFLCVDELLHRESSWRYIKRPHRAVNRSSGAYGIPQALPAHKMAEMGHDYRTNPITQIKWFFEYTEKRYGDACAALRHHDRKGWY